MSELVRVAHESDMSPGDREIVTVDNRSVGVFNIEGEYYALPNRCLHMGGPLCEGRVQREIEAIWDQPGERTQEKYSSEPTVACPWHGWEYSIKTGEHIGDDNYKLTTYDVFVENGIIYVDIP